MYDDIDQLDTAPILWDELNGNYPGESANDQSDDEDEGLVSSNPLNNDTGFDNWQKSVDIVLRDTTQLDLDDLDEYDLAQAFIQGATPREAAASVFASDKLTDIVIPEEDIKFKFGIDKLFIYG